MFQPFGKIAASVAVQAGAARGCGLDALFVLSRKWKPILRARADDLIGACEMAPGQARLILATAARDFENQTRLLECGGDVARALMEGLRADGLNAYDLQLAADVLAECAAGV